MTQGIIISIKYAVILLMTYYTYASFRGIKNIKTEKDVIREKKYCFKQSFVFFLIHGLMYTSIYLHTYQDKIIIFYGVQLLYFILLIQISKLYCENHNRQLLNVMSMMLMIGFVMLTRLSIDKAIRQFVFCVFSTILASGIAFAMRKAKKYRDFYYLYAIIGIGALCAVYAIGKVTYGAKLSINLGFISIQPSEFVKISYVMFICGLLYKAQNWKNIILSAIFAGIHIIVLVLSSDLGTALIFCIVYIFLIYMATGKSYFLLGGLSIGCIAAYMGYKLFYHVQVRVAAWLDPWPIIDNKGYQITQSLFAIGTGGLFGMGLFEGMPNAIPVVDQDFIFSAISEELGAIFGVCIILLSFNVFLIFIKTAIACKDDYYRLLCAGLAVTYGFQLFLTVGGSIKMIPSTGVTYPLISYGGSSLMSTIFMFFIVQGVKINENKQ